MKKQYSNSLSNNSSHFHFATVNLVHIAGMVGLEIAADISFIL